jgi:hypothetical protein
MWNRKLLHILYLHLLSFALNENITLSSIMSQEALQDIFRLPLSEEAYIKFYELDLFMQLFQSNDNRDQWKYIWGNYHYSSSRAYKHLIGSQPVHPAFKWLWTSSCQ